MNSIITSVCPGVVPAYRGSAQGEWGVGLGSCLAKVMLGYTLLLWTEFLAHACENITSSQLLLWSVIMWFRQNIEVDMKLTDPAELLSGRTLRGGGVGGAESAWLKMIAHI